MLPNLNKEHKLEYNEIIQSTDSDSGQLFLPWHSRRNWKNISDQSVNEHRSKTNTSIAAATSGIAATLLEGGRTSHVAFKLLLHLSHYHSARCDISKQTSTAHVLRESKLTVCEQCTMAYNGGVKA